MEDALNWKKGRGKLGAFQPLLGSWVATADSAMGPVACARTFRSVLDGKFIELKVRWQFNETAYEELAIFGMKDDQLSFWSFTSDGKHSEGVLADASDIHEEALCFEAQMPAGLARQIYWPDGATLRWAVESKNKKGWNRFTEHEYKRKEN
jgi:hypothetical protein